MRKILHTTMMLVAMLIPMVVNAQTGSMEVHVAVNNPVMGTTNPAPGVHYFAIGTTPSVVALPNDGYRLMGWRIQSEVSGIILQDDTVEMAMPDVFDLIAVMNGGNTFVVGPQHTNTVFYLTSLFEVGPYVPDSMLVNVAVNNPAMGTTTPAPGAHYFYEGDTCSVVALPNEGYNLTGWDIQMSVAGTLAIDTTIDMAIPDVFDLLALLNSGNPWVVAPGYGSYTFNVTANFIDASQYIPDSMVVNVAVNNPAMGTTTPGQGVHYYAEGDMVSVTAQPNSGYHLAGWDIQISIAGATVLDTTVNIDVRDVFDLVLLMDEIGSIGDMNYIELFQMLARPMGNWVVTPLYAQATFNLTALFAPGNPSSTHITYAVAGHDSTLGSITPAEGTYTIMAGEPVVASATPNNGYELSAWIMEYTHPITIFGQTYEAAVISDTVYANDPAFSNPIRFLGAMQQMLDTLPQLGMYLTAVLTPQQFTTTLSSSDNTMGTVDPEGDNLVAYGSTFTATAIANSGYHFVNWVDENNTIVSTENPYTFTVIEDRSLTAVFAEGGYYNVLVNYDSTKGTVTGVPDEAVLEGTVVTLTAVPNAGYRFVEWSTGETSSTINLTVTSDITITATFDLLNGIDDVNEDGFQVYSIDNRIIVQGAEKMPVSVYDVIGRNVQSTDKATETVVFTVPGAGIYMIQAGTAPAKRVVVR